MTPADFEKKLSEIEEAAKACISDMPNLQIMEVPASTVLAMSQALRAAVMALQDIVEGGMAGSPGRYMSAGEALAQAYARLAEIAT